MYFSNKILKYPRKMKFYPELALISLTKDLKYTIPQLKEIAEQERKRFNEERKAYYEQRKWLIENTKVEYYNSSQNVYKRYRILTEYEKIIRQQNIEIIRLKEINLKLSRCN